MFGNNGKIRKKIPERRGIKKHHRYIDLHLHSNRDGGGLSPQGIAQEVFRAYKHGKLFDIVSLTDHCTLAGQQEFYNTIQQLKFGKNRPVVFWGVEFPVIMDNPSGARVHILAYADSREVRLHTLKNSGADGLINKLGNRAHNQTLRRIKQIGHSFPNLLPNLESMFAFASPDGYLTRESILKALVASSKFDYQEATNFLGCWDCQNGNKEYDLKNAPCAQLFLPRLHDVFKYLSWAHPNVSCTPETFDPIVTRLSELGVNAIEAYGPKTSKEEAEYLEATARKFGLYLTAGSDEHFHKAHYRLGLPRAQMDRRRLVD